MTDRKEIESLIAWAQSQGATVDTLTGAASIYEDGSACYRVIGLKGCGPHPMTPIQLAERLRALRAQAQSPDLPRVMAEAQQMSAQYTRLITYVYQFGAQSFGFRFGPLPSSERGLLVACFYAGDRITPRAAGVTEAA